MNRLEQWFNLYPLLGKSNSYYPNEDAAKFNQSTEVVARLCIVWIDGKPTETFLKHEPLQ